MDFFHFPFPFEVWPFLIIVLAIAFTFHEFAHAFFAFKFGDPTAFKQGRVTLNPLAHLDLFGTIMIFIAGFGWAKPVPVNRSMFKRPRLMGIVVSAAGPLSNLLIAFAGLLIMFVLSGTGILDSFSLGVYEALVTFFNLLILLNIILFLFNLLPVPPLDGYRIIEDLAPHRWRARMSQYEHWGVVIFLIMVFIPPVRSVTIDPIFSLSHNILYMMTQLAKFLLPFG